MTTIEGFLRQLDAKIHHWTHHYYVNSFERDDSVRDGIIGRMIFEKCDSQASSRVLVRMRERIPLLLSVIRGDTKRLQRIRHEHQTPLDLNGLWSFVSETLRASYAPSHPDRRYISAPVACAVVLTR